MPFHHQRHLRLSLPPTEGGSSSIPWLGLQRKPCANQQRGHSSLVHFVVISPGNDREAALICRQTGLRQQMPYMYLLNRRHQTPFVLLEDARRMETMVRLWAQTYCAQKRMEGGGAADKSAHSNGIFTDMSSFPLHQIISRQSPNHNPPSQAEWPLYIRIDMSPAVGFLHDNDGRLRAHNRCPGLPLLHCTPLPKDAEVWLPLESEKTFCCLQGCISLVISILDPDALVSLELDSLERAFLDGRSRVRVMWAMACLGNNGL